MSKKISIILVGICLFLCLSNIVCARDFIDYKNDIAFDIKNSYEMIRSDEKLYGFQNDEYKIVYSVIENGQITDVLDFKSFDEISDDRIKSTINNMGLNPIDSVIDIKESTSFSTFAFFEGKSGELKSYKVIFYNNDRFYIFQIVSLTKDKLTKDEYLTEITMITSSIKEYIENKGNQNFYYAKEEINEEKENKEDDTSIKLISDTEKNKENSESIFKTAMNYFSQGKQVNINVIIYILGNLIAILLLRRFVVIFEYSYIKYPVAIALGCFGYKLCENFFFSMDYTMNKPLVIIGIIVILCIVLLPKRHKKRKNKHN